MLMKAASNQIWHGIITPENKEGYWMFLQLITMDGEWGQIIIYEPMYLNRFNIKKGMKIM